MMPYFSTDTAFPAKTFFNVKQFYNYFTWNEPNINHFVNKFAEVLLSINQTIADRVPGGNLRKFPRPRWKSYSRDGKQTMRTTTFFEKFSEKKFGSKTTFRLRFSKFFTSKHGSEAEDFLGAWPTARLKLFPSHGPPYLMRFCFFPLAKAWFSRCDFLATIYGGLSSI